MQQVLEPPRVPRQRRNNMEKQTVTQGQRKNKATKPNENQAPVSQTPVQTPTQSPPVSPAPSSPLQTTSISPSSEKKESTPEKKTEKKKLEIKKKDHALANGISLPISKKHSMYISSFIKGKSIDQAIKELEQVLKLKRAVPFKGEIPHRKGPMMSGRYPLNAAAQFILLLKGLKGNAIVNGLDLEKTVIVSSSASWAPRPQRRGGVRAKRTHVIMIAKEKA